MCVHLGFLQNGSQALQSDLSSLTGQVKNLTHTENGLLLCQNAQCTPSSPKTMSAAVTVPTQVLRKAPHLAVSHRMVPPPAP